MGNKRWRDGDRHADKFAKSEKIGRREKKTSRAADLKEEFEKDESTWSLDEGAFPARVVEVHKRYCFVSTEKVVGDVDTKDVWLATIARKFLQADRVERNFFVVGDRVLCVPAKEAFDTKRRDLPQCVVQHLSPRRSQIARMNPHKTGYEHVLASNIDQLVIVASYLSPKVRWGLIDRYLVLAEEQGIPSVIVLNKSDLLEEEGTAEFKAECVHRTAILRKLGYQVIEVAALGKGSAKSAGVVELRDALAGKFSLFSGHSGVGKSSLVNLFKPELVQAVEPDADIFYKGRHTTSYASFIKLGTGGYVIDTPGIRSFMLREFEPIELSHCFVEMRPFLGRCKFRECRHIDEPGCIIKPKVEAGEIAKERYMSYLALLLGESGRSGRIRDMNPEDLPIDMAEFDLSDDEDEEA